MPRVSFSCVDADDDNVENARIGPFSDAAAPVATAAADCCDVLCLATAAKAIGAVVGIIVDEDDVVIADDVCCCCCCSSCCCCDDCDGAVAIAALNAAEMDVVTFVF